MNDNLSISFLIDLVIFLFSASQLLARSQNAFPSILFFFRIFFSRKHRNARKDEKIKLKIPKTFLQPYLTNSVFWKS